MLEFNLGRLIPTGYVIYFISASSNTTFEYNSKFLWSHLRNRQISGFKFRRQFPIGPYIVDFVCLSNNLIIELNGGQHTETVENDEARTNFLNKKGFRVIRFWNNEVFEETEAVLQKIYDVLMNE